MIKIVTNSRFKINRSQILTETQLILSELHVDKGLNINIVFVGARMMRSIATKYKQEKVALPVLSFSYIDQESADLPEAESVAGEIFICFPQAVMLAAEREKTVDKTIIELVKHGIKNIFSS